MRRQLLAGLSALTVLGLAACAAGNVAGDFRFGERPDTGLVVASIGLASDAPPGGRVVVFYDTRGRVPGLNRLQSYGEPVTGLNDKAALAGTIELDGGDRLLVVALPAGHHSLDVWQLHDGRSTWVQPAGEPEALGFEVRAGEVTYLGHLRAGFESRRMIGLPVTTGGRIEVGDRRERDLPAFARHYPQFAEQVKPALLRQGAWTSPDGVEVVNDTRPPTPPGARR